MKSTSGTNPPRGMSRRGLLKGAAAASVGAGFLARSASALGGKDLRPPDPVFDYERFLFDRISMGFNLREFAQAKQLGYHAFLRQQLDYRNIDDTPLDHLLKHEFPSLEMGPYELWNTYARNATEYVAMYELKAATLLRNLYSNRQLFERMAGFWSNHFSQHHDKVTIMLTTDQRDVIRKHTLGDFPSMLGASAHSASMLAYLDNGSNVFGIAQENYARELLELHTMGVRSGYTETDVKEVARCLTGWAWYGQLWYGDFNYFDSNHDPKKKMVLGYTIPKGGGQEDGEFVIRLLGSRRETSEFIARKMAHHLLRYDPSDALVDKVARVYRQTDGDIRKMVLEIFDPANVQAEGLRNLPKLKTPYEYVVSLLRALDVVIDKDMFTNNRGDWVIFYLFSLGQVPFQRVTPDGYPDKIEVWGQSVLPRWQFATDLLDGNIQSTYVDIQRLEKMVGRFEQSIATEQIDQLLTGGRMSPNDKEELRQFIENSTHFDERILREAIALGAQSPSFQLY